MAETSFFLLGMGYLKSKSTLTDFEYILSLSSRSFLLYLQNSLLPKIFDFHIYISYLHDDQNQLAEDKLSDQMSMEEFIDPFTGEPVEGYKKKKKSKRPFEGQ